MTERTPQATIALVKDRAARLVAAGRPHVLVLRARPRWTGDGEFTVAGARVLVRPAVSQLAALAALAERGPEDYLILLTDRPDADLGDVVLVGTAGRGAESLDEWAALPGLFEAQDVDPALRRLGSWVPLALIEHQPKDGWPAAPTGVVTADHALGNLLGAVLGLELPVDLDLMVLLTALDDPAGRGAWHAVSPALRKNLAVWAATRHGEGAGMALAAAARGRVSVVALGLVLDVLWPDGVASLDPDQGLARGRVEAHIDGQPVHPSAARILAGAARTLLVRMDAVQDPAVPGVLAQAEALLGDLGWRAGAERSSLLPAGLTARLHTLAGLLDPGDPSALASRLPRIEGALTDVVAHYRAAADEPQVTAARMAVRLARWLAGASADLPTSLGAALREYLDDGAWVDRAAAVVWDGSTDEVLSAAYARLLAATRRIRDLRDQHAAALLVEVTARDAQVDGVTLIERAMTDLVVPVATAVRPVVILLDGMSAPVATELADAVVAGGWTELVPAAGQRRTPVLAALPTLTRYSRTAFFTGELRDGGQDVEKAAMRERLGAPLFHKDDLRAPAGEALPAAVRAAIDDPDQRVVGVVLNTIDDALARHDPGGMRWGVTTIQHLQALLNAAWLAGRGVVLTSDHGHVVERGSEVRPAAGGDARWRPVASGPAQSDEVIIRGRRVVPGELVLPWRENLRYASLRSGYHGGASLAEITVPFVLLVRGPTSVPGWVPAAPQAPAWWNEERRDVGVLVEGRRGRRRATAGGARIDLAGPAAARDVRPAAAQSDDAQGVLGFDVPVAAAPPSGPITQGYQLVDGLEANEVYRVQRRRAGRHALAHQEVVASLTALLDRGGRAHRDTLAIALGVPASSVTTMLAALTRLMNVDGYPVVSMDPDGVTVRLDEPLLRDQFELGGDRG